MGQGFVLKGKVLCGDCYQKLADYEVLHDREVPSKRLVEAETCQNCGAPLAETEI